MRYRGTGEFHSLGHKTGIEAGWRRDVFINWFRIPLPASAVKLTQEDDNLIRRVGPLTEPYDTVYSKLRKPQVRRRLGRRLGSRLKRSLKRSRLTSSGTARAAALAGVEAFLLRLLRTGNTGAHDPLRSRSNSVRRMQLGRAGEGHAPSRA